MIKKILVVLIIILIVPHITSADFAHIAVTTDVVGKVVRPGDTAEFVISLEKGYNTTDDVSVTLFLDKKPNDDWMAGFYEDSNQVSRITFPAGESGKKQVTLRVRTPENASDDTYVIKAGFQPYGESVTSYEYIYRDFVVDVDRNAALNLDMYADIPGRATHPGTPVTVGLKVENDYDSRTVVKLDVISKPLEWGVDLLSDDGFRITKICVPANDEKEVDVIVCPPMNVSKGDYTITIGAAPESGDQYITEDLSISINPDIESPQGLSTYMEINAPITGLEIRPETPAEFIVTLRSRYDQRIYLNLKALEIPENWSVEFLSVEDEDTRITTLEMPPGGEQQLEVRVRPTTNMSDGTYPVIVGALLDDGRSISQKLEVTINEGIEKSQILSIYPSYSEVTLNPGSSTEVRVNIRNNWDETLENVQLEVQDVSGIKTEIRSFGTIEELEPGESRTIPVEITARADAGSGVKELFMRARSSDIQSEEKSIKVDVKKSSGSGFIGIGLVVLAILVLAVMIRKFGRR